MSDDLIERLELCARAHPHPGNPENGKLLLEAAARIRELESEIQYRRDHTGDLIQDRDECKVSMVHYALDLKAAKRRIRELESRLATAEADAMERAARVLSRASEEIRALKPKADE